MNEKSKVEEDATYRLLTRSDVLVKKFRAFDTDEIEATLFRNGRRQKRLATSREAIEKQAEK
jgi:hypothetical protein